jgi:SAM-dependent methyltransferase
MLTAQKDYASFKTRTARSQYVFEQFRELLKESILDVGCDEAPLRDMLPDESYFGIDVGGSPDQIVNLEQTGALPFEDDAFNCVLCIEVLEHLNNLHTIFHELFRVSSRDVIVSLPNCWCGARQKLERGRGNISHYGLPAEAPPDRHKWFFNATQALEFFDTAAPGTFGLTELRVVEKPRAAVMTTFRHLRYASAAYDNRYVHTVFAVYRRHDVPNPRRETTRTENPQLRETVLHEPAY